MVRFHTFGGLRIERDGEPLQLPTQGARDLLAYLLAFRERPHPRPVLAGTLWPDLPESKARRHLSDTLWRVRRVLGDHVVVDDEHICFNNELPYWLDVEQFLRSMPGSKLGRVGAPTLDEHADRELIEGALTLYQGPFLDGLYHDWALAERERLRGLYLVPCSAFSSRTNRLVTMKLPSSWPSNWRSRSRCTRAPTAN